MRDDLEHLLVAPDIVLERRDIEIADQNGALACTGPQLGHAVQLISGATLNDLLTHKANRLTRLLSSDCSAREIIEELYWTALSRAPGDEELSRAIEYIEKSSNHRAALEDLAWALLNAKEFLLRN